MATYQQWAKSRTVRRVTWVCGPEYVLAREVVAAHRAGAPPGQCETLVLGDVPERRVWDTLFTDPGPAGRRVTVYGAELLEHPEMAAAVAADAHPLTAAVFVSSDDDFARDGKALVPHLAALQSSRSAQLVRCCAPSRVEDQAALVRGWWPGSSPVFAQEVLTRCGSLSAAYLACEQARLAGLKPGPAEQAAVCHGQPGAQLADLLMAGSKGRAMNAAAQLDRAGLASVIGLLASKLAAVEQLAEGVREGSTPREVVSAARAERFQLSRALPHLQAYNADRIARCRAVLAGADAAWRNGAFEGVPESLVSLW
jgi:hypothetical protein